MIPLEEVPCSLCGSRHSRVRHASDGAWAADADGHFAATTDKFGAYGTVRECLDCGMSYTSPRPTPAALFGGYENNADLDYAEERDARCMNAHLSLAVIRRHVPGGRLLEVGSANGFFLNAARTSYAVSGVEPSRWASSWAAEKLGLPAAAPTLEAAGFPDASFDVVAIIDVIEHVPFPLDLLKEIARILRPGGIIYLVTPDIDSLSARVMRRRWWGLRPAHIHYFSARTITSALERAGFTIVEMKSYGRIFSWGYWFSRLSNYPAPLRFVVSAGIELFGIRDKFLYLDTRDSVQVIARR